MTVSPTWLLLSTREYSVQPDAIVHDNYEHQTAVHQDTRNHDEQARCSSGHRATEVRLCRLFDEHVNGSTRLTSRTGQGSQQAAEAMTTFIASTLLIKSCRLVICTLILQLHNPDKGLLLSYCYDLLCSLLYGHVDFIWLV